MSSYEQRVQSVDKRYQYLLFAAEPYDTIAFRVPSTEIDKTTPNKFFSNWDPDSNMFTLQIYFKTKAPETNKPQPPPLQPIVQEFNSLNDLGPVHVLPRHTLADY